MYIYIHTFLHILFFLYIIYTFLYINIHIYSFIYICVVCVCVCVYFFLELQVWHMEVPRLGVELELQLLAYSTAIATWDPSLVCTIHHSSQWSRILKPLSKARDQTHILMDTSWVCYCWVTTGTPMYSFLYSCSSWSIPGDCVGGTFILVDASQAR